VDRFRDDRALPQRARHAVAVTQFFAFQRAVIVPTRRDEAVGIHRDLGSSLFESVYEVLLAAALEQRGLHVERQRPISFSYKNIHIADGFRADLIVEDLVIVEIKSIDHLAPVHTKQILTYMRLANLGVGLLLNFGAETMSKGIKRVVRDLPPSSLLRADVKRPPD
jgi:GxxExxY protein